MERLESEKATTAVSLQVLLFITALVSLLHAMEPSKDKGHNPSILQPVQIEASNAAAGRQKRSG